MRQSKLIPLVLAVLSATMTQTATAATANPLQSIEQAIIAAKTTQSGNSFAGYSGLCLSGVAVTNSGPQVLSSMRSCFYQKFTKGTIRSVMSQNNWPLELSGQSVDYFRHPTGWYMTTYNKAGEASEITVIVDTTTD